MRALSWLFCQCGKPNEPTELSRAYQGITKDDR